MLIDGTVRHTPVAEIQIESPYFSREITAVCIESPLYDLVIGNISGAADPQLSSQSPPSAQPKVPDGSASTDTKVECWLLLLLLPVLLLLHLLKTSNGRQPDIYLREPSLESSTVRPKLKLLPRTVKGPVNIVVHIERNTSICGTRKPCESSSVNEAKRTLSQSSKSQGQSTNWRETSALIIKGSYCQTSFRTHARI